MWQGKAVSKYNVVVAVVGQVRGAQFTFDSVSGDWPGQYGQHPLQPSDQYGLAAHSVCLAHPPCPRQCHEDCPECCQQLW